MKKKILIVLIVLLLPMAAFASSVEYTMYAADYPIMVNGEELQSEIPAMCYEGTTLLPLRKVAEALDIPIEWKDDHVEINTVDVDELAKSCVMIYTYKNGQSISQGSGVLIGYNQILTCNHVICEGDRYIAVYSDGSKVSCKLVYNTTYPDMAILKPNTTDVKPVKIGDSSEVKIGDKIVVISCPKEKMNIITYGEVTSLEAWSEGVDGIETTAKTDLGSSGGAVFNMKGELIGMNKSIYKTKRNHVIPLDIIRKEGLTEMN